MIPIATSGETTKRVVPEDTLARIAGADLPVLRATTIALRKLEANIDRISGKDLTQAILRDPLMTLLVIRFITSHRTRSQTQDITTIAHALMMLGLSRFFREFHDLPVLQDELRGNPAALGAALNTLSRARTASLYAREWAVIRHDVDPEEVVVATLLHDIGDVVWRGVLQKNAASETQPETEVPPPALMRDAQHQLFVQWKLPGLLVELMDNAHAERPRVQNVGLACQLARDAAFGWRGPRVDETMKRVQRLLHVSIAELHERVVKASLAAARDWTMYGVRPAAYYWPMLPEKHP